MWNKLIGKYNFVIAILLCALMLAAFIGVSFLIFTFGYWLVTLILATFFGVLLPFSWWYSLGAWLIVLVVGLFILPGWRVVNYSE